MDGNGRWARQRGLDRVEGHVKGVDSVREAVRTAKANGVEYLTLYVFSTENWGRPRAEVEALMSLLCKCVRSETPELVERGVRIRMIGERSELPAEVQHDMAQIEADTAQGTALTVLLAVNYSSRAEIARAVREGGEAFEEHLYTAGIPDPDLVIRTGGDHRLSNFLLWQAAYSELYFTPEYWPDFGRASFEKALADFGRRERRWGRLSEDE
jgi:undecaprenyl diphosphate synthase